MWAVFKVIWQGARIWEGGREDTGEVGRTEPVLMEGYY